jgi:DNA-directed RNA polymerase subunit RPC12/RpoP
MAKIVWGILVWSIALAVVGAIVLLLGLYLYGQVEPLRDKPLVALTLRDLGNLAAFVFVAVGGAIMLFRGFGEMAEQVRNDVDSWRRLKRRVECPDCGELAWNDDGEAQCPHCQWRSFNPYAGS